MSPRMQTALLATVLAALPATAAVGQVQSHCLPKTRPPAMVPLTVTDTPAIHVRQISAPLAHEQNQGPAKADDADIRRMLGLPTGNTGRADARSLSTMLPAARRVVEQARAGEYQAAAQAGDGVLRSLPLKAGDYTWDYVASATAWSHLQLGRPAAAAKAHGLAAARVRDPAVRTYHRLVTVAIRKAAETPGGADRLKDPANWKTAVYEELVDTLKAFHEHVELAKSVDSATRRIVNLQEAYKHLRVLETAASESARQKAVNAFREAADTLCTDSVPSILDGCQRLHDRLRQIQSIAIKGSDWVPWVRTVQGLWDQVREAKRICRVHDYLRRVGLASSRESQRLFRDANNLLFVGRSRRRIWNLQGGQRTSQGRDVRKTIDCDETLIRPM